MENQHRKISGYRELSQGEIDLMNEIKALGPQIEAVVQKVQEHLTEQDTYADLEESTRLMRADPSRWASTAETQLQLGLMALTRAIAQPTFF